MNTFRRQIARVDAVLREVWDPIGVCDVPETRHEYSSYAPRITGLLRSGATDAEIQCRLAEIVTERMEMPVDAERTRRTLAALRAIPLTP